VGEATSKSLLLEISRGEDAAWARFSRLYEPMIRGWLLRHLVAPQEADDLAQDVLTRVFESIAGFQHGGRNGSFRSWLRVITVNRAREFWRAGKLRAKAPGGSEFLQVVQQLEDPDSAVSSEWNATHDQHVLNRLLALLETDFEPTTVTLFRKLVFEQVSFQKVAEEFSVSIPALYSMKSRVLKRLREEAAGLLD
jgi:RNA polymerase sigma-70 factor (ECF subfamily)